MLGYVARRALYTLVVLFIASIIIFWGLRIAPGDPANTLFNPLASEEAKNALREKFGLDEPIVVQYGYFLRDLFTGDLGESIKSGKPIPDLITEYGKNSLVLVGASIIFTYALAIPLGVIAAVRRNTWVDNGLMGIASLGMGIPNFLLGLTLILVFGSYLGWLPISGTGGLDHLILPVIALSMEGVAVTMRLTRSAMLEEAHLDYVRALEAKGLRRRTIVWKRMLRNALIPIISLSGIQVGALIGYTAIVEIVFRWPGLGQLLLTSVLQRDYPVALWLSLLLTAAVVLANFAANIGYALADPRVRVAQTGGGR
jgi:peptide/nickel transport system permease protein/oligopeptide transport system permease protein